MPKYIDSEALKRDLIDNRNFYPAIVANAIEHAPACDVVEVVRCKDCKYGNKDGKYIHCRHFDSGDSFVDEDFNPDDFCSYGERKKGRKIKQWNT